MGDRAIRAAALQIEAEVGNLDHNLEMCEREADSAAAAGAEWIVLPEFFSSGVAYRPELAQSAPPPDGAPTQLLRDLARRHGAHVGGSTLVRDRDGHVRNAFLLAGPDGELLGRHDKDLPTMWENALYTGGGDPGRIEADGLVAGVALCWELMRTQTLERLGGRVDVVLSGSGWWSIPPWPPRPLMRWHQERNKQRALRAPAAFAEAVGAPVIHAAHSGSFNCPFPLTGVVYHGHYQGGAMVCSPDGRTLAFRGREEGPGFALAEVVVGRRAAQPAPDRFWLQRRGSVAATLWAVQNIHGRREYRRTHAQQPRSSGSAAEAGSS
ncbi:MAG: carbon-nitrogen hydrolase family protein [Solirubrobacterales bacterium]|nr:carbon-nitrogen hydrolase family protein [Solirubrobacterales bacterium]